MRRRRLDRPNALAALPTKLVSWNLNGLARRVDDEGWKEFTREMIRLDPDVMALQEVKALLPSALSMAPTKP